MFTWVGCIAPWVEVIVVVADWKIKFETVTLRNVIRLRSAIVWFVSK